MFQRPIIKIQEASYMFQLQIREVFYMIVSQYIKVLCIFESIFGIWYFGSFACIFKVRWLPFLQESTTLWIPAELKPSGKTSNIFIIFFT